MPKIKIVWTNAQSRDGYDDAIKLIASSGDWQEVTDEELAFLRKNIYTLQSLRPVHTWVDRVFIIEEESTPMPELIQRLKDRLADLEKQRAADRKSTRLNSSHSQISYAGFFFKKNTWMRKQTACSDFPIGYENTLRDSTSP